MVKNFNKRFKMHNKKRKESIVKLKKRRDFKKSRKSFKIKERFVMKNIKLKKLESKKFIKGLKIKKLKKIRLKKFMYNICSLRESLYLERIKKNIL